MNRAAQVDPRILAATQEFEDREEGRYRDSVEFRFHTKIDGEQGRDNGLDGYDFDLHFRDVAQAVIPLTWIHAALEMNCSPHEGTQCRYLGNGCLSVTVWVAPGGLLSVGLRDFIGAGARTAAFAWSLDVLPAYSRIAARVAESPSRFEHIGESIREALLSRGEWILPEVLIPCDRNAAFRDDDSTTMRAATTSTLARLREGLIRWRDRL